ncbi:MAG: shikimate kinase [Bacteroidia bacterium]|nr:shikimate kinase [Bacteroidia bacterium]MDW8133611.1 shikimate kinase [Bacteroidia bacterium]
MGLPLTGKSTLGRKWAEKLQVNFIDTDVEIERRTARSIMEWFQLGETEFRKIEAQVFSQLLEEAHQGIWAVGGGFPLQGGAMTLMRKEGYTIWLDPPLEWWLRQVRNHKRDRPILSGKTPDEWRMLFESRRAAYREADLHWSLSLIPEPLILRWIASRLSCPLLAEALTEHRS